MTMEPLHTENKVRRPWRGQPWQPPQQGQGDLRQGHLLLRRQPWTWSGAGRRTWARTGPLGPSVLMAAIHHQSICLACVYGITLPLSSIIMFRHRWNPVKHVESEPGDMIRTESKHVKKVCLAHVNDGFLMMFRNGGWLTNGVVLCSPSGQMVISADRSRPVHCLSGADTQPIRTRQGVAHWLVYRNTINLEKSNVASL